jgi:hypothetical protein
VFGGNGLISGLENEHSHIKLIYISIGANNWFCISGVLLLIKKNSMPIKGIENRLQPQNHTNVLL